MEKQNKRIIDLCESLRDQIDGLTSVKKKAAKGWRIFKYVCLGIAGLAAVALIASGIGAAAGVGITTAIVGTWTGAGAVAVAGTAVAGAGVIGATAASNVASSYQATAT